MLGTPDELVETMEAFRQHTGINTIICWFNSGGQPHEQVLRSMETFSKEVMPRLRVSTD